MNAIWLSLVWVLAASLLGFVISAVFAGRLGLSRLVFLIPYLSLTILFLAGFFAWNGMDLPAMFLDRWPLGLLAGLLVGAFLVLNVHAQPASRQAQGSELAFDVAWLGLAYGILDGLYLNVMPVLALWVGFSQMGWPTSLGGEITAGLLYLAASMLVTLTYHLGYPEFRNKRVTMVVFGNTLITLAYLLSTNPLGAVLGHAIMHVAAVLRGPETTLQLPPHYSY